MDNMLITCVVIILVCVVVEILLRKSKENKLFWSFQNDLETFDHEMMKKSTKMLIPPFNYEYMKLNRYMMTKDYKKTEEQFDKLFHIRKSKEQSKNIYLRGFCFFLEQGNQQKANLCMDEIDKMEDQSLIEDIHIVYDIYINKDKKCLQLLQQKKKRSSVEDRQLYEYLYNVAESLL